MIQLIRLRLLCLRKADGKILVNILEFDSQMFFNKIDAWSWQVGYRACMFVCLYAKQTPKNLK
jgi:hypothetical protein